MRRSRHPRSRGAGALLTAALAVVLASCAATSSPTNSPTATPDFQRSTLDIVYSGLVESSYFRPNGSDVLTAAFEAMKKLARESGGTDDVAAPAFLGTTDSELADFRRFADAAATLSAKNPRIESRRFGDVALRAMLAVAPDCHTYFVPGRSSARPNGLAAPLGANVSFRMLGGNVGYVQWRSFDTFVFDDVRKALDELVAQGARSWLFDLRGNGGGQPPQFMSSWFIKDGVLWRDLERDGRTIDIRAQSYYFLPPAYQLPIAVVIDAGTASSAEYLSVALQQRGRAKIFGSKSAGCLGGYMTAHLASGAMVAITSLVSIGPTSDAPINGVGIIPDVVVTDRDPLEVAGAYLRSLAG